jgi:hypothetical protein
MDLAALTMLVFGGLITASGMTGLFMPGFLLSLLGLGSGGTTEIFVIAVSQASLAMGLYYMLAAVHNHRMFIQWSVPLRCLNFIVFSGMVLSGVAPLQWLLVAGLELLGALATGITLLSGRGVVLDPFHLLRIVSAILAAAGAVLAFQPFGIYGSASIFLAVSSLGFMYAYMVFPPAQIP